MEEDDIQQMANSHKNYLKEMIAEQEAALSRFQNSAYLSDSHANHTFSSSVRGGRPASGGHAVNSSLHLNSSASASPYTFARGGSGGGGRALTAAPTPGYTRRATSPTPSSSSSGSTKDISLLVNARRTLAEASGWAAADAAASVHPHSRSRNLSSSGALSPGGGGLGLGGGLNDTAMSTATITSEVEAKIWNKDKLAWERRMAELEDRLKRVNGATAQTQQQQQQQQQDQQYNVAVVNGRGAQAGAGGALAPSSHNVHTSSLVLRLEQELATAVEALVRERQSTSAREANYTERTAQLEEELAARERKSQQLNTKWMSEFEKQARDYQEQLEKAFGKTQHVAGELEEKEREITSKTSELKKTIAQSSLAETELHETKGQVQDLRAELERQVRRGKDFELQLQQLEHDKKNTLASVSSKQDRQKEEWMSRMDRQKEELQVAHDKEMRAARQETTEVERKWREVEHDAFILSGELVKWKDLCATRDLEIEKIKSIAAMDRAAQESTLRSERDTMEVNTKTTVQRMQGALDEAQALLLDTTSKLETEIRRGRDSASRIEQLESELRSRASTIAERDSTITAKEARCAASQAAAQDAELAAQSQMSMVSSLRHSNDTLLEEVQMLQKKLDARSASKSEELRVMESEHKKFREKSRARADELEKSLEESRAKQTAAEQRCDAMKHDFDLALTAATAEQAEVIRTLERKVEKVNGKLSNKADHAILDATEKDRMISQLRSELDRRSHAEALALHQLAEVEARYKKERTKYIEVEAKLNHMIAVAPDSGAHQRALSELVAAKQVATNIQGRYRELQGKFERQSVRQNALQQLLTRLQEEQQHTMFRSPAKTYLASGGMPLYRPLDTFPTTSSATVTVGSNFDEPLGSGTANFSNEEEDMFRVLMRDQERQRRVRKHVRAYARGEVSSDDDLAVAPAAGRSTYNSRTRSRSVPRDRITRASDWSESHRTRDDADVNLNLKVNFDPRLLKRMADVSHTTCVHTGSKPHDSRSCKVCQRRAFGRGMDANQHYAPEQHIPSRASPSKSVAYDRMLPHV